MAVHPIETVKDEIKARGMSKKDFAQLINMQQSNVSRMFSNRSDITLEMAERLERALGIPADFWIRMQLSYNKDAAEIAKRNMETEQSSQVKARTLQPQRRKSTSLFLSSN